MMSRHESKSKPRKCPECQDLKIATILYGMPAMSEKLETQLNSGKIVLGGCCITGDDPTWQCVDCKVDIYRIEEEFGPPTLTDK